MREKSYLISRSIPIMDYNQRTLSSLFHNFIQFPFNKSFDRM